MTVSAPIQEARPIEIVAADDVVLGGHFWPRVRGTAAEKDETQLVPAVHAFPGHIACDSASRSEVVVPIHQDGAVCGVLDLDSTSPARFNERDAWGLELVVAALEELLPGLR